MIQAAGSGRQRSGARQVIIPAGKQVPENRSCRTTASSSSVGSFHLFSGEDICSRTCVTEGLSSFTFIHDIHLAGTQQRKHNVRTVFALKGLYRESIIKKTIPWYFPEQQRRTDVAPSVSLCLILTWWNNYSIMVNCKPAYLHISINHTIYSHTHSKRLEKSPTTQAWAHRYQERVLYLLSRCLWCCYCCRHCRLGSVKAESDMGSFKKKGLWRLKSENGCNCHIVHRKLEQLHCLFVFIGQKRLFWSITNKYERRCNPFDHEFKPGKKHRALSHWYKSNARGI